MWSLPWRGGGYSIKFYTGRLRLEVQTFYNTLYYVDKSVLVENRPLVKFIRNYIGDSSYVFSISSLVRISMTSFPALTLLFLQKNSCLYNKKKITRRLEDMNFVFSWWKTIFYLLAGLVRKTLFLPLENKIHIFAPPCNILYVIY